MTLEKARSIEDLTGQNNSKIVVERMFSFFGAIWNTGRWRSQCWFICGAWWSHWRFYAAQQTAFCCSGMISYWQIFSKLLRLIHRWTRFYLKIFTHIRTSKYKNLWKLFKLWFLVNFDNRQTQRERFQHRRTRRSQRPSTRSSNHHSSHERRFLRRSTLSAPRSCCWHSQASNSLVQVKNDPRFKHADGWCSRAVHAYCW